MNTFETIDPRHYTVDRFLASSPISWTLTSSSLGCVVTTPTNLEGAVTIERASNNTATPIAGTNTPVNPSGLYERVAYQSIKTLFYDDSIYPTAGLAPLADNSYIVSVGQQFYGSKITPQSFTLKLNSISTLVVDDGDANLLVNNTPVGRIFYDKGIAVITENTAVGIASVSSNGIKIVNGTSIEINYNSDVEIFRHQIDVKIPPGSFNAAILNPSMQRGFSPTGPNASEFVARMKQLGIDPIANNKWSLYRLMAKDQIKPYITTIGLYDDSYQLLAVAKLSIPIQRTFETSQIFMIRFDVNFPEGY
jgi:hypothetical protein